MRITLTAGQVSDPIYVNQGARVTFSGAGTVEYAAGTVQDAKAGVVTWKSWPGGTLGYADAEREMVIRATATGNATLTIDDSGADRANEGVYWQSDNVTYDPATGEMSAGAQAIRRGDAAVYSSQPQIIDPCHTLTGLTTSSDGDPAGTITVDAVNFKEGPAGIKFTLGTLGTFCHLDCDYGSAILTLPQSGSFGLWVYLPATQAGGFNVYLSPNGGYSSNYASIGFSSTWNKAGWNLLTWNASQMTITGSVDFSQPFRGWRVRWNGTEAYPTVTLGGFLAGIQDRPRVMFDFDDGWASQYSIVYPSLAARGWSFNVAVVPSVVGNANYCSLAQLQEMYRAGVDMLNHTLDHTNLTTLTTDQAIQKVIRCQWYLASTGMDRASRHFVFPENAYSIDPSNFTARDAVASIPNIDTARSGGNNNPVNPALCGLESPYTLRSRNLGSFTLASHQAEIDKCILRGGTLIFYGHKILSTNNPGGVGASPPADGNEWYYDDWIALLDYLSAKEAAGLVDVGMTRTRWMNMVNRNRY